MVAAAGLSSRVTGAEPFAKEPMSHVNLRSLMSSSSIVDVSRVVRVSLCILQRLVVVPCTYLGSQPASQPASLATGSHGHEPRQNIEPRQSPSAPLVPIAISAVAPGQHRHGMVWVLFAGRTV